ncbi:MAG: DUF4162 domain-containing protein, partial [Bacillota bacterium]|nr:DUF4162 domain-containing protein [Bacillota bacterium]
QYLEEADQLADKIAILNKGKIVAEGTPAELKKLLPQGHFELKFHNERYIRLACDLLKNYSAEVDEENQILSVTATGGIKQLTAILNQLETANISLAEFEQKLPTLEDVFLTIIGEKQEQEGA